MIQGLRFFSTWSMPREKESELYDSFATPFFLQVPASSLQQIIQ